MTICKICLMEATGACTEAANCYNIPMSQEPTLFNRDEESKLLYKSEETQYQKQASFIWKRGELLITPYTKSLSKEEFMKADREEQTLVLSNFNYQDDGRSRELVATLNRNNEHYEENARLIVSAPELLKALKTIKDAFYTNYETDREIIEDLKSIAEKVIAENEL